MHETFISAPFGNWIKPVGCIPVTGTYTLHPQGNRLWRILRTLRYDFKNQGWRNRLGLPNTGVKNGLHKHFHGGEVLSIAEVIKGDFRKLVEIIPERTDIELNLSCPNLGKSLPWDSARVFTQKVSRKWCIAKLSPLTTPEELRFLVEKLGFTQLHFSNTLPFGDAGGISGPVLREFTRELIELCRKEWGKDIEIIAGGGVDSFGAVSDYLSAGANHISLGSVCFNPFKLRKLLKKLDL